MRLRAARVDENHREIVDALRAAGCSVLSLAAMGSGVPDLLVARNGHMWLVEVKKRGARGNLSSGAARSLKGQTEWAESWRGPVHFVDSVEAALALVGAR
jgi:Holliday junction resolvase